MGVDNGTDCSLTSSKGAKSMAKPDPRLQIRKLPYRIHRELSKLLDIPGDKDWTALASVLPDGMYSRDQIETLRSVGRNGGSPSEELLRDLGFQLTTVRELIGYLTKLNHQEALLLLKASEPVEIVKQPVSISVTEGSTAHLSCGAKGFPKPSYQWFKVGYGELETGFEKELNFDSLNVEDAGNYFCKVANDSSSVSTNTVNVQVIPSDHEQPCTRDEITRLDTATGRLGFGPSLLRNDALEPMNIYPGQYFKLSCGVEDLPNLNFYWLKNGREIPGENRPHLIFNPFRPEDEGYYSCRVVGQEGDMLTKLMHLKVGTLNCDDRQIATGKVALVIGNQNYACKRPPNLELVHPIDDARTLGSVLSEMGYRVICLVDLNQSEMQRSIKGFCEMLSKAPGMYGLFYFGGHGYEENGKTYLVPVDAPSKWSTECTICADEVLSDMQQANTKLNVLILDVCRTPSGNDASPNAAKSFDPYFVPGAQSVICYATCPQSQAFERKSDVNGIYIKHLIKHIRDDKKIEDVIHKVHSDVSTETRESVRTKTMSPTYTTSTTREFRLLDPVLHDLDGDPTEQWFQHHRLPSSHFLDFESGIKAKLSFEHVCSNLCDLVLHVEDTGSASECDVSLFEVSKQLGVEEKDMNIRTHVFSNLVARSNPDVQQHKGRALDYERRTRLPNLQRLIGNFALTLEVVYAINGKEIRESKYLIINKSEFGITSLFK